MGIIAGMTIGGKIPFGTFANFSTGRVFDQIRQSIAYQEKMSRFVHLTLVSTLGEDGATHQILEDIGLMKMLQEWLSLTRAITIKLKMQLSQFQNIWSCLFEVWET